MSNIEIIALAYLIAGCGYSLHMWHLLRQIGFTRDIRKLPFRLGELMIVGLLIGTIGTWPLLYLHMALRLLRKLRPSK